MKTCKHCNKQDQDKFYASKTNVCKACHKKSEYNRYHSGEKYKDFKRVPKRAVYAIYDEKDQLQYIGESGNAQMRLYSHFNKLGSAQGVIEKVDSVEGWTYKILWRGSSELARKARERMYIQTMQPPLNKLFKNLL